MKKAISFLLALTLACSMAAMGCAEEIAQPKLETAVIQADGIPAILCFLDQGTEVEVKEALDEKQSLVETEQGTGMMETQLLRFPWEPDYETWIGYARHNTPLFKTYELYGNPLMLLAINTEVLVLDELEDCYLISLDLELSDTQEAPEQEEIRIGFVEKSQLSKTRIQPGSGGGGNSGPSRQDGGDISMAYYGLSLLSDTTMEEPEKLGKAQVRVNDAKLIILYFQKGDTVQLIAEEGYAPEVEGYLPIYLDGTVAYIPVGWVLRENDEPFESWDGYASYGSELFDNYLLRGEALQKLPVNTKLTVLWDNGMESLVQLADGTIGILDSSMIRTSPVSSGNGGNSGNSNNADWTPPVL